MHQSRGLYHHADSTRECPDCGRRFQTHTGVVQRGDRIGVSFQSKQDGRWGVLRVSESEVVWADTLGEAWAIKDAQDGGP